MSGAISQFLTTQLDAYNESRKRDHDDAMASSEVEVRMGVALALFQGIRRIDEEMSLDVAAGRLQWDAATTERLMGFYRAWESPAAQLARRIDELQAEGHAVPHADDFQRAVLQARATLSISVDRLERSARQARAGSLRSIGEIRDELRDKLRA